MRDYQPQTEIPTENFKDLYDKKWLGSLQRIYEPLKEYFPYEDIDNCVQTNFCFFRSKDESQVSATDLQLILPLHDAIRKQVLQSGYVQADESPIRVLDKDKKGSTHQGYYWVFHSPLWGLVLFDYQKGRSSKLGLDWMEGYQGYLQSDGYAGYDDFASKAGVTHLSCLAHARRYFEQAEGNDPVRARKAILYTLARINPLMVYLSDARLLPDNNLVENTIRPLAIGRKNYLFAGSHQAAQRGPSCTP